VPEGGGVILKDKYVVTQPAPGEFKAFTAICTHAGCPVKKVEEQQIKCPCHGSRFSITDGSPVGGPAKTPLAPVKLVVSGKDLVIPD
jgi:Rieske Fe-S protein